MNKLLSAAILLVVLAQALHAQTTPDAAELTKLLNDFLAGASRNDVAMHDRFWADDLIYTRSAGQRVSKADVMRGVRSAPAPKPDDPKTVYTAEDIRIQQYGTTAIVAFRLVGTTTKDGATQVAQFLNTGTFLKRNDKWQVVAWQSTRMPRSQDDIKAQILDLHQQLSKAILDSNMKRIESFLDETFVWTSADGRKTDRQQLLEALSSGRLKYAKLESSDLSVVAYGDTAILRGTSVGQSVEGREGKGLFTATYVNQGGEWKLVALHTSPAQ